MALDTEETLITSLLIVAVSVILTPCDEAATVGAPEWGGEGSYLFLLTA